MFRRIFQYSITVLVFTLVTYQIVAQSDPLTATINLNSRTQVGDKVLEPGQYHVVFEGSRAGKNLCAFVAPVKSESRVSSGIAGKFDREGNVVAEMPCTLKTHQNTANEDSVVTSQNRLTEVHFKGKPEAVDFTF